MCPKYLPKRCRYTFLQSVTLPYMALTHAVNPAAYIPTPLLPCCLAASTFWTSVLQFMQSVNCIHPDTPAALLPILLSCSCWQQGAAHLHGPGHHPRLQELQQQRQCAQ